MSLVLRVDVDKPFGHASLMRKIASKLVEDYLGSISPNFPKYLSHQIQFLQYCNDNSVPGFFYYRTCTKPSKVVSELMKAGGHKTGFHAENTRSLETLSAELGRFRDFVSPAPVETFTKHGSGVLKLGKHHYPPYEPNKYKEWAKELNCSFPFGNEICEKEEDLFEVDGFHDAMFWIEPDYRNPKFNTIEQVLSAAKHHRVIVLIHPENFASHKTVSDEFKTLVKRAREESVSWEVF